MITAKIKLNTIEKVKKFSAAMEKLPYDIDLYSERYIINGKSIMGIFSLDLSKEINVKAHTINEKETQEFTSAIEPYRV